jgi:transposase-like protein
VGGAGLPGAAATPATRRRRALSGCWRAPRLLARLNAPELEKRSAWYRSRLSFSWRVDETYVRVKGRWKYLYRAIDKEGATLDFYLADRRKRPPSASFLPP